MFADIQVSAIQRCIPRGRNNLGFAHNLFPAPKDGLAWPVLPVQGTQIHSGYAQDCQMLPATSSLLL